MHIAYAPLIPGELVVGQFPPGARIWVPRGQGLRAGWRLSKANGTDYAMGLRMHRDRFERALRERAVKLPRSVDRDGYFVVWLRVVSNEEINFSLGYYLSRVIERDPQSKPWDKPWPPLWEDSGALKKPLPLVV